MLTGAARNDVFGLTEQTATSKGTLLEATDNDDSDTILYWRGAQWRANSWD